MTNPLFEELVEKGYSEQEIRLLLEAYSEAQNEVIAEAGKYRSLLLKAGVYEPIIDNVIRDHSIDYIQAQFEYLRATPHDPTKQGAVLANALKNNLGRYDVPTSELNSVSADTEISTDKSSALRVILAELEGDEIRQRFIEEVIRSGDSATLNTFIKHRFNNPHIQELWLEFIKRS